MKSIQVTKFKYYVLIAFFLHVNGSFLSRLKNRYEYLPLSAENFTFEEMDYVVSSTRNIPTDTTNNLIALELNNLKSTKYYKLSSEITVITNYTKLNSGFTISTEEPHFQKRTISTKGDLYYYEQNEWPAIKLFVAPSTRFQQVPSATDPTKQNKRTWPPYFPPKFISKLQAELDDALLPWKSPRPVVKNVSAKISPNLTGNIFEELPLTSYGIEAFCYMCGLDQQGIPRMPGCYHVFENDDHRTRKLQRRLKVKCITSSDRRRVKNKYYGPDYIGGCFKRFLDIGVEYNERGCRTQEPTKGRSYASRRLAYLERMLKDTENGCVFSPYASLTPFSRAISLYARYHVCVCNTKYCNHALHISPLNLYTMVLLTVYFLI